MKPSAGSGDDAGSVPLRAEAGQPSPATPQRYGWPIALTALLTLTALMLALYWPGVVKLVNIWLNSQTFAHGMLIVPLSLYLVWTRRSELALLQPRPSGWGLPLLVLLGLAWFAARIVDITTIQTFVVVALLPVLTLTVLGTAVARALLFPLCFLFFAWPAGNFLVPILQDYTAWFSVLMLKLSGVPVYLEGRFISIPNGNFVVADVCSGIRYLIASVAMGSIYAYLMYRSPWRRLAFVCLAILFPIIANGLRAYGIIMIAHWSNMEYAVGVDHLIYGWVFFLLVMLLLFWIGGWFREPRAQLTVPRSEVVSASLPGSPMLVAVLVAAAAALALGPVGDGWMAQRTVAPETELRQPLAPTVEHWQGDERGLDDWRPMYAEPDRLVQASYRRGEMNIGLYLLQYRYDAQGSDLIRYDNRITDDVVWRRAGESVRRVALSDGEEREVREMVLRGWDGKSRIVWYWYQVGDTVTIQPAAVKLLEAWARLRRSDEGSLLVALAIDYQLESGVARAQLEDFIADAGMYIGFDTGEGHDGRR